MVDQHDLGSYQRDESHVQGLLPWACIRPRSPKALKALVKFAQQEGWALIPRGSGTGKAGGCLADQERSVLVDFAEWPQELSIDPIGMQLTASCSVPLRKVKEEAEAHHLFTLLIQIVGCIVLLVEVWQPTQGVPMPASMA